jgi:Bacterial transglutaminase-like N-terminal region
MPRLTIHHNTVFRYAHAVAFGEHRSMLRPRDSHDLRVIAYDLRVVPEPMSLRRIHDVFGNSVAIATFDERSVGMEVSINVAAAKSDVPLNSVFGRGDLVGG